MTLENRPKNEGMRANSLIWWYIWQTLKNSKTPGWGPLEQGVCGILFFNKYTYFWQFAYLFLLSMWKYTYFQPKWLKRQKLGNFERNCLQFLKFIDVSRIFCSFSYLKSYVLFKTEQKLTKMRMEMSLWLQFLGAIFFRTFSLPSQLTILTLKYTYFLPKNRPKNTYFAQIDTY